MTSINLTDLRRQWFDVLSGVLRGRTYVIFRQGQPIAQLAPYQSPALVLPTADPLAEIPDPELISILNHLVTVFGRPLLAELLGSTPAVLQYASQTGFLSPDIHPRLDFLHDLSALLCLTRKPRDARLWMTQTQKVLGGRSPAMILGGTWHPGTPWSDQVWVYAGGTAHG